MTALLVDARNALYRAIYAVKADRRHAVKYHYVVALLRQFVGWIREYNPESIHVFWDAPRSTVWRRKILDSYKDRSTSTYVEDISQDLKDSTEAATELFKYLNIRQYSRKQMEADDLIYAAAILRHPKKSIIISTDSDMTQIPFMFNSCVVYDPSKMIEVEIPRHHPAMMKSIVGDKADCIDGYYGIGPKKGAALVENVVALQQFLDIKGRDTYHRNLLLTDLSYCPRIMANKLYVQRVMAEPVLFDKVGISDTTRKYKILGLDIEYANIIPPFTKLK